MVVGRDELYTPDVRALLHGDVAEGMAQIDAHAGLVRQGLEIGMAKEHGHYLVGHRAVDGAGRVGQDLFLLPGLVRILQRHHVAAVGHVARSQLKSGGGGLQRRPAGEVFPGVAAENGHNGCLAAGGQPLWTVDNAAQFTFRAHGVYVGLFCIFQRGLVSQLRYGIVGHAVAYHKHVFHRFSSFPGIIYYIVYLTDRCFSMVEFPKMCTLTALIFAFICVRITSKC